MRTSIGVVPAPVSSRAFSVEGDAAEGAGARAWRGLDPQLAADRRQAVPHPGDARALAAGIDGETTAVVAHLEQEVAVEAQLDADAAGAAGVLGHVLQRLQATEVDGALGLGREPADALGADRNRQRRAPARPPQGLAQAGGGEPPPGENPRRR